MSPIKVYTDGACSCNPGPGGWGVLIRTPSVDEGGSPTFREQELFGGEADTTNNRMELLAVIKALGHLPTGSTVDVYTDSQYVRNGITAWIHDWKARGWKTSSKKPVKNQDLWMVLDSLRNLHKAEFHWVRGHNGHEFNERADALSVKGIYDPKGE